MIYQQCCGTEIFIPDPGSEFFPSRIPDPGSKRFPDPGSGSAAASRNLSILTQKTVSKLVWFFYPSRIRDPGVEKAPDPGSGYATLSMRIGIIQNTRTQQNIYCTL
jgi:hypothetical protein